MELIAYIRLFRKWWWLLLLATFLAGGASFIISSRQPDMYQASTKLSVGGFIQSPNPDSGEIRTGVELAQTYAVLAETYEVLEAAIEAQNFPVTPGELRQALSANVIAETSLLELSVTYTDPVLAADMANEVAQQLIINSPSNLTTEQQAIIDQAQAEIDRLNEELQQDRQMLRDLDAEIAATSNADAVEELRVQRNEIASRINQTSANIAQFSNTITDLQQRTNSLDIVERARIPTSPTGTGLISRVILGAMVGLALGAGVVLLIEYLDDTIRTSEQATQATGLPTLAVISKFGKPSDKYSERLIAFRDPGSHAAEEYRALRTNLMFSANDNSRRGAFVFTSPGPAEGKSVTTANLAVAMATAGWRVLLIEADLRRPRVHEIFGLNNDIGLSTLLSTDPRQIAISGDLSSLPDDLQRCIQRTDVPGLRVITSGYLPLNPTEVLGSVAMRQWYREFQSAKDLDVILFDTPPCLVVADSSALATAVKAPVVLLLTAGKTRRGAVLRAKEQFDQLSIEVRGLVLNAANPREENYNYGYGYSYYYYYDDGQKAAPKPKQQA